MNEYDDYVTDYLTHNFKNMRADLIPRDFEIEAKIITASKIEYLLESSKDNVLKAWGNMAFTAHGKSYEINFEHGYFRNIVCTDQQGHPKIGIGDVSILEELGICAKGELPIRTPLISLFRLLKNISIEEAITQLAEMFEINRDTPLKPETNLQIFFNENSIVFLKYCQTIYKYHIDDCDYYYALVLIKYLGKKKVLIPVSCLERNQYCFPPVLPDNIQPLFNGHCLKRGGSKPIVILTDSIELAGINQIVLDQARVYDIVWISWWSDGGPDLNFEWSLLKNHRVFYILKEHSGLDDKTVYINAKAVKKQLDQIGVKEFKYVHYHACGNGSAKQSMYSSPFPIVYTVEEFEKAMSCKNPSQPLSFKKFKNDLSQLAPRRRILMSPFIYDRSATLICGDSASTWFALNMTFALSKGKSAFEGWCSGSKPAEVLYLYGEDDGYFSFGEKLNVILKVFTEREKVPFEQFKNPHLSILGLAQPFPKEAGVIISFSKFSWNVINKQQYPHDYQAAEFVNSQVASVGNQQKSEGKLLVLDNLFSDSKGSLTIQNILINEFKRCGWAVIIVDSFENKASLNKLNTDSVIKIRKNASDKSILEMSVKVDSLFNGENKFICKLDFNAGHPAFMRIKDQPPKWPGALVKPRCELVRDVKELYLKGFKGQAIADELGISLSMVKKLKAEFKISKPRVKKI